MQPSAANLQSISIILLDCADEVRIKRLKNNERSNSANQNTLNWAAWLRMHCQNPCWEPHVIKNESASLMQFKHWETLTNWPDHIHISTINTSFFTITQTAQALAHVIKPSSKTTSDNQFTITFTEANLVDLNHIIDLLKDDTLGKDREQLSDESNHCYQDAFKKIKLDENAKNYCWQI